MGPLIGMAGLAEAGEFFALLIGYGGLLLAGVAAALGLFARSRVAAGVALVLALAVTLTFLPWEAFRPSDGADPDVHDLVRAWRLFGWCWGVTALASVAAVVGAFGFPEKPTPAVGAILGVVVETVGAFGLLCRYGAREILVPVSETSWVASYGSCHYFAEPGDELRVKVLHVDADTERISASTRALHPDPWPSGALEPGSEYEARVVRSILRADRCSESAGYLLELLPGTFVMLHGEPPLQEGQTCPVTVVEADSATRTVSVVRKEDWSTERRPST